MRNDLSKLFVNLTDATKFDARNSMYPSSLHGVVTAKKFPQITSTFFGFIYKGSFELKYKQKHSYQLGPGSFFSCPGEIDINGNGSAVIIEREGYIGLLQIGLIEEESGRLCYIDNASTTILVAPPRLGDPVLNYLVFSPNTIQTAHIHPTIRLGMVIGGEGECVTDGNAKIKLLPGMTFMLPERLKHSFNSFENGLKILAYHPDSDVGPTDASHPMLSRTYLVK